MAGERGPAGAAVVGASPWALARRRLLRNRIALVMLGGARARRRALPRARRSTRTTSRTPTRSASNLDGTTIVNGKKRAGDAAASTAGLGLGVDADRADLGLHHYFLGADDQGRDVAARLLYGGRNSLLIGTAAALITCFLATLDRRRRRLLRRHRRRDPLAPPRRHLGVPGLPARDQPLDRAAHAAASRSGPFTLAVRQPLAADPDHRRRLHPVRRAADPRRGAVAPPDASSSRRRSGSARRPGGCSGATSCRTSSRR